MLGRGASTEFEGRRRVRQNIERRQAVSRKRQRRVQRSLQQLEPLALNCVPITLRRSQPRDAPPSRKERACWTQRSERRSPILDIARGPMLPNDQQHKTHQHRPQWAKRQRAGVHDRSLRLGDSAVKWHAQLSPFWLQHLPSRTDHQGDLTGRTGTRSGACSFVSPYL